MVSPAVALSDVRRWAIATYWPDVPPRLFWDEEYAGSTHWGGIVAPEDFNPFAWLVPINPVGALSDRPGGTGRNVLNGGLTDTFYTRIRPGDVIISRGRIVDVTRKTGGLGTMDLERREALWENQRGEPVKRRVSVTIWY